jgi:hypothetical protein
MADAENVHHVLKDKYAPKILLPVSVDYCYLVWHVLGMFENEYIIFAPVQQCHNLAIHNPWHPGWASEPVWMQRLEEESFAPAQD